MTYRKATSEEHVMSASYCYFSSVWKLTLLALPKQLSVRFGCMLKSHPIRLSTEGIGIIESRASCRMLAKVWRY